MNETLKSKLLLIMSMVIFGTIGIFRRYIPLSSAALAMVRGFIGMLSLLIIISLKKQKLDIPAIRKNAVMLFCSGAFIGINWILLFEAYNYTTVAVATLCYYMAPVIITLLSPLVLKERLSVRKVLCILVALFGMVLVSGVLGEKNENSDFRGVFFGLGAAVFYATVILMNKKLAGVPTYDKTIVQLGSAGIVLVPYVLLMGNAAQGEITAFAVIMVLVVGVVHTGLTYALYFGSISALPAQTSALFSYIDPVVAIILSALILSEKMGAMEIIGTVCVLCATAVSELPERK